MTDRAISSPRSIGMMSDLLHIKAIGAIGCKNCGGPGMQRTAFMVRAALMMWFMLPAVTVR